MKRQMILASLLASYAALPLSSAFADEATDLAAIRKQLNAMQHEYEAKITTIETIFLSFFSFAGGALVS